MIQHKGVNNTTWVFQVMLFLMLELLKVQFYTEIKEVCWRTPRAVICDIFITATKIVICLVLVLLAIQIHVLLGIRG